MKTKRVVAFIISVISFSFLLYFLFNRDGEIRLIIRGDDMGFSHAVNRACINSYKEGILTAVEVMVPGAHFLEAVAMLKENPGLDVGIHLTLTSEWENIKWGPISYAPSLTDEKGHFYPMIWPEEGYPPGNTLATANWNIYDIERELRAQIETILHYLPRCSHATPHMGFHSISPEVNQLAFDLIKEYDIDANIRFLPLRELTLFGDALNLEGMITNAIEVLENLEPGTYEFYEHPGMLIEGEEPHWHIGAEDDAKYRDLVTKALTSEEVKKVINDKNIKLIGYRDLKFWH